MKKLLFISTAFMLSSCISNNVKPIEKHRGMVYVKLLERSPNTSTVLFKNKDTIYTASVLEFDLKNIKEGDTIK